jgi:hypothetical protein
MQTDDSRLSSKSYTIAAPSEADVLVEAQDAIESGLILNAQMPAVQLAELLASEAEPELAAVLSKVLVRAFYLGQIRKARLKEAMGKRAQALLPGFEHLPLKIPTRKAGLVALLDANLFRVRDYYRALSRKHNARRKNDSRIKEAKALLDKMQKYTPTNKGINVRQVLALEDEY